MIAKCEANVKLAKSNAAARQKAHDAAAKELARLQEQLAEAEAAHKCVLAVRGQWLVQSLRGCVAWSAGLPGCVCMRSSPVMPHCCSRPHSTRLCCRHAGSSSAWRARLLPPRPPSRQRGPRVPRAQQPPSPRLPSRPPRALARRRCLHRPSCLMELTGSCPRGCRSSQVVKHKALGAADRDCGLWLLRLMLF